MITHSTSFVVMPDHCNYMSPLIFGGKLFAEMDLCAAVVSSKALSHSSFADNAVTFKFNGDFVGPSYLGDLITLQGELVGLRDKSMTIRVTAWRQDREKLNEKPMMVAKADFVFVARFEDTYSNHGLFYYLGKLGRTIYEGPAPTYVSLPLSKAELLNIDGEGWKEKSAYTDEEIKNSKNIKIGVFV